jgi:hypothetical protein
MRRRIAGLQSADTSRTGQIPDGIYLVRVQNVRFRKFAPKPYYSLGLAVVEPQRWSGSAISSRIYCNRKALWRLNWFLRDFGYDLEQLEDDEVDEIRLIGLKGVIKISNVLYDNMALIRIDGFAPAAKWAELSPSQYLDQQAS